MTNPQWDQDALRMLEPIFRELFLDNSLKISATTSPNDIEEWDSLAHITLLASVEEAFDVHFTAEEMSVIVDVSTLLEALRGKDARA
jgi:acyl carrier protein